MNIIYTIILNILYTTNKILYCITTSYNRLFHYAYFEFTLDHYHRLSIRNAQHIFQKQYCLEIFYVKYILKYEDFWQYL